MGTVEGPITEEADSVILGHIGKKRSTDRSRDKGRGAGSGPARIVIIVKPTCDRKKGLSRAALERKFFMRRRAKILAAVEWSNSHGLKGAKRSFEGSTGRTLKYAGKRAKGLVTIPRRSKVRGVRNLRAFDAAISKERGRGESWEPANTRKKFKIPEEKVRE